MTTSAALLLLLVASQPVFSTIAGSGPDQAAPPPIDELCLGCICEAATNCDRTRQCRGNICGLFAITRPYWLDAGSPVIPGDSSSKKGAFERCVTEPYCAAATVREYMARYAQDCNGNGVIDCQDYATLHHLGRTCRGTLTNAYRRAFELCERRVIKPAGK